MSVSAFHMRSTYTYRDGATVSCAAKKFARSRELAMEELPGAAMSVTVTDIVWNGDVLECRGRTPSRYILH